MIVSGKLHKKNHIKKLIKNIYFFSENMINSVNYIYDYAHSFYVKDFYSKPLYWQYIHLTVTIVYSIGINRISQYKHRLGLIREAN